MPYVRIGAANAADSLFLRYRVSGNRTAEHTLLCVHELGGTLETFDALADRLAPWCRLVIFDQRGAGLSEHVPTPFSIADLAADIDRLVAALELGQFHLFGLAMGAVTALTYAVQYGAGLRSLILCDPTGEIDLASSQYLKGRAQKVRAAGMRAVADATLAGAFKGTQERTPGEWTDYRARFVCNAPNSYALQLEALAQARFDDQQLRSLRCATLVITGENDAIWPPEVGRKLADRIAGSRFEKVSGSGHLPPVQAPDAVAAHLKTFLLRLEHRVPATGA